VISQTVHTIIASCSDSICGYYVKIPPRIRKA
jgi:hypothetical protein